MLRSRAVAKENPSNSCNTVLIFGIGKSFLTNLLFTSQKLLRKWTVLFVFGIINDGKAHSDAGCCSNTPSLHNLSTSLMMVSLCIFGAGKARLWWGDMPSLNWKKTDLVLQSSKVPSKSNSYFMRSCSNFFSWLALRCLQLSLTIDWRSALFYLESRIKVACLVVSSVLFGSMATLLFSFSARSVLAPCRWLMSLWQDDFINGYCLGFKVQHNT